MRFNILGIRAHHLHDLVRRLDANALGPQRQQLPIINGSAQIQIDFL